jgi:hypothetical protein
VDEDEERVLSSIIARPRTPPGIGTLLRAINDSTPPALRNSSFVRGKERIETEMLKAFLNYGLVAAVIVWAGVVALMAYRLDDSPWRWAFAALAVGGIATVAIIFRIRRYVDEVTKASGEQGSKS